MYYSMRLKGGVPTRITAAGRVILVDSTGAADSIDITPMRGGQELRLIPDRQKAFKCHVDFDAVVFQAPVDCTVGVFLSMTDVSLGFADGMLLKVSGDVSVTNDPDNPVPVSLQGGTVNVTATNVGINNQLTIITDFVPASVGIERVQLVGDPTQKRLRIRNGHGTAVLAIGGPNLSLANAAIKLQPGDMWIEEDAPGATWYAISDTANTPVQIQGLK
jgi:hypothetical protein